MDRNLIVCLLGDLGQGKTLLLTTFAYILELQGYLIISNYDISFPHFRVNKVAELEKIIEENPGKNFFFCFDEPFMTADARQSQSKINIQISQFALQSRKVKTSIGYTARYIREVELRLRAVTNWVWLPRITGVDEYGKPVVITVTRLRRNVRGEMFPSSSFSLPCIYFDPRLKGFINTCDLYNTAQLVKGLEGKKKIDTLLNKEELEELKDLIITGKYKKKELRAKLIMEKPNIYKSDIEDLIDYLFLLSKDND